MTKEQLTKIAPTLNFDEVNDLFNKYSINTPFRQAMFLAQCSHESAGFKYKAENLNYSAESLNKVFPKYFKNSGRDAAAYARNPEKIANVVYANRMGNGDTVSGDGYKFRGRGYIQLTGKENYTKFAAKAGLSLEEAVAYCETDKGALESALYFWDRENLNSLCVESDVDGSCLKVTKRINGGTNGLDDRKNKFKKYLDILK